MFRKRAWKFELLMYSNMMIKRKYSSRVKLSRLLVSVKKEKDKCNLRFSSCFEFITSSNLSHVGPCCVLGHFRLSFHGQAFDDAWSFRSCSFKASRRKKKHHLTNTAKRWSSFSKDRDQNYGAKVLAIFLENVKEIRQVRQKSA